MKALANGNEYEGKEKGFQTDSIDHVAQRLVDKSDGESGGQEGKFQ